MHKEETEFESINLMEYFSIAWKRRWQIIIPTVVLAVLAAIVSFSLPRVWEVDALVIPSKFMTQSQTGEFKVVLVADPKQIASQITEGAYNRLIAAELKIPEREFPTIKAENLRDTNLVRVSVREKDIQKGKQILSALFNHLKSDFDRLADVEVNNLNTQVEQTKNKILDLENEIKNRENAILTTQNEIKIRQNGIKLKELDIESRKIDKEKLTKEIESDKSRLKITEDRIVSIYDELRSVKERIKELEEQQRKALAEQKEGTTALGLLLYSNEVQRNLQYSNSLDEKASAERLNRERVTQDIQSKTDVLRQIDNQIDQVRTGMDSNRTEIETMKTGIENIKNDILKVRNNINDAKNDMKLIEYKKNRIDYTQLIKEPTSSFSPVSPKKKQNVLIGGFIGFCFSLGIVFFRESLEKIKRGGLPKA
jgi:capsular polysaccharide biosynthesis protein